MRINNSFYLVGAVFIIALAVVGRLDFNDQLRSAVGYCDDVTAGLFPDYNNTAQFCPDTYQKARAYLADYSGGF